MKALGVDHHIQTHTHHHNLFKELLGKTADCKHLFNEDSISLIPRKNLNYFFVDMVHQKGYKDLHQNNDVHAGLGKTTVEVLNRLQE